MYTIDEKEKEYRHGNHGPKYLMKGPYSNFGIVALLPGETVSGHVHKIMEENFYILSGTVQFEVDGNKVVLTEGQFIHLDPGEGHIVSNPSDETAQMIVTAAPYADGDKYSL